MLMFLRASLTTAMATHFRIVSNLNLIEQVDVLEIVRSPGSLPYLQLADLKLSLGASLYVLTLEGHAQEASSLAYFF